MNSQPLAGRVALVTGASSGIGSACALALADAGAAVAVGFSANRSGADDVVARILERGGAATTIGADLSDPAAAIALVDTTVKELGGIDIVVNNAGITRDNLAVRITDADWDAVIAVDLSAAFRICRAALRPMLRRREGRIINISSIAGVVGNPGQANYSAAKAGLQGMARTLAIELGPFNVNVNSVAPGFVETRMTRATAERLGVDFEAFKIGAASQIPLRRVGQPEDIASVIAFLCSDESSFVSGQTIYVRGGP
jgi:3-oxoacyl-[acyl-carrier protein] reductase